MTRLLGIEQVVPRTLLDASYDPAAVLAGVEEMARRQMEAAGAVPTFVGWRDVTMTDPETGEDYLVRVLTMEGEAP